MNPNEPVISFIVVTYNSAEFITETLNSAREQTYQRIELIITDDHSSDNTVELCKQWISENHTRFIRTQIVISEKNTGTSANLNRGIKASTGTWFKFIAGDDYLYPDCFETFLSEVNANPEIKFLFANTALNGKEVEDPKLISFFALSNKEQYKELLKNSFLPAPAAFISRDVIDNLHGFDERYKLLEDYPFFLKASKSGIKFFHVNKSLVYYRVHENNISHNQRINLNYFKDIKLFFKLEYLPEIRKNRLYLHYIHYSLQYLLLIFATKTIITKYNLYNSILSWASPLNWKLRIENRLLGNQLK